MDEQNPCGWTKSEPENAQFLMIPNEPLPNYHHPHSSSRPFDRWSQINPSLGGTHYKALHPNLSFGDRSRLLKVIESQRSQKVKWFSMIMSSSPSFDSIFSTRLLLPALTTLNIVVWVFEHFWKSSTNSIRGQDPNNSSHWTGMMHSHDDHHHHSRCHLSGRGNCPAILQPNHHHHHHHCQLLQKRHHPYLIFIIFLHGQNFWIIKFTPKNANFSR